jgi:hypothetical protein
VPDARTTDGASAAATTTPPSPGGQAIEEKVPLDDEAKALKLAESKAASRKAIAQHEKDVAEAQKAELAAKLPSAEAVKPLEGKVELGEKTGLVADLLAHSLVGDAAAAIAAQVKEKLSSDSIVLVVEDRALAKIDWPYEAIRGQTEQHKSALAEAIALFGVTQPPEGVEREAEEEREAAPKRALLPAAALPVARLISVAPAAVNALASVVGMFRSDYAITNRDVTIGTTPLIAAIAGELAVNGKVAVSGFELVEGSAVAADFWDAWGSRARLERLKLRAANERVAPVEEALKAHRELLKSAASALDKALAAADSTADVLKRLRDRITELHEEITRLEESIAQDRADVAVAETVLTRFEEFASAVVTTAEGAAYPPLVAAAIQERLRARENAITHVLYVGLEGAGGETIRRRNLFLGPRLTFVGGVQVSHLLLDVDARTTVAAGTQSLLGQIRYKLVEGNVSSRVATTLSRPLPAAGKQIVVEGTTSLRDGGASR